MERGGAMSTKVLKDQALESYYQAQFDMHGMQGWKYLMEDLGRMLEVHDTVTGIDTEQQLWFRKGELAQMQWLYSRALMLETAYAAMLAEQEGTDEVAPTGGTAKVVE
jgi:hypothetical protein